MPRAVTIRFTTRQRQVRMDCDENRRRGTRRRMYPWKLVPLDGVDLNTLFDELQSLETALKPYAYALEELGL